MQLDQPLAVVTPAMDGDVLAALVYRRHVGSTPGQIQYLLGRHTTQGIRLSLARLLAQGVVQRRSAGNAFEYRLHPGHLATPAIIALGTARKRLVARTAALLKKWPHPPVYAAFFGPAVAADMRVDDPLDLFLACAEVDTPALGEHIGSLATTLRAWTGNDLHAVTVAEADVPRRIRDDVMTAVEHHGVRVLGWPSWLERQHILARELAPRR